MPQRCKVCTSILKDEIERMIMQGHTFYKISKYAEDRGLLISDKSLRRHADNHMPNYQRRDNLQDETEQKPFDIKVNDPNIVDIEAISKELKYNPDCLTDAAKVLLGRILLNQLNIVCANQMAFMQGLGRYPKEQIQGLNTIFDLLEKINPKNLDLDKKFDKNNIYLELTECGTD
ncbi:MAG: hypothetical protein F6J92_42120 [Symploca sp. SIO1A3]|nr:hypothetical protein [Symploca sp. SIO1A3]